MMLYVPGDSWLHRRPPWMKFTALFVIATVAVIWPRLWLTGGLAVLAIAVSIACGVPWQTILRSSFPFIVMAALIVVIQFFLGELRAGVIAALRLSGLALTALVVVFTTRPSDAVDDVERGLRRLGVSESKIFRMGLLVGVLLRSLGHLGIAAMQVRDARRARGMGRNLRAFAVPMVVSAGRFAHGVGEAMEARGIADPDVDGTDTGTPGTLPPHD